MNTPEEIVELCYEWAKMEPDDLLEARARLGAIWDLCAEYIDRNVEEDDDYELDA